MERYHPVREQGFFNPAKPDLAGYSGVDIMQALQMATDQFVVNKEGEKGSLGEVSRVIHWSALSVAIAIFDFTTGQQIGLTRGQHDRFDPPGSHWYWTELVVASEYQRQGFATLAREHMKQFLGYQVPPPAFLIDVIEANEANTPAVRHILESSGAKKEMWDSERGPNTQEVWIEPLVDTPFPVPASIYSNNVVFEAASHRAALQLEEGFDVEGQYISYKNNLVAQADAGYLETYVALPSENTLTHLEGVKKLWGAARVAGYKSRILV